MIHIKLLAIWIMMPNNSKNSIQDEEPTHFNSYIFTFIFNDFLWWPSFMLDTRHHLLSSQTVGRQEYKNTRIRYLASDCNYYN